jgi:hypothetical protein
MLARRTHAPNYGLRIDHATNQMCDAQIFSARSASMPNPASFDFIAAVS